MAVHNKHSLRSFPSFCENENFDEDDDNNFVISLEDSGDDDDQKLSNTSPVCSAACPATYQSYNSHLNQANSTHSINPYSHDVQNISNISSSAFPSSAGNRDLSAHQHFIASPVSNTAETELHQSVCGTLNLNHQYSSPDGLVPVSKFSPVAVRESYQCDPTVTVSPSIDLSGTTDSPNCATDVVLLSTSLPENIAQQLHQNHKLYDEGIHQSTALDKQQTPSSDLSKIHLETIHLDKEVGGIWSEAVFLPSVGITDRSFSDIATDSNENVSFERIRNDIAVEERPQVITSNITSSHCISSASKFSSYSIPKLPVVNPTGSELGNAHFEHEYGITQKIHPVNENAACTCIMCYKENGTAKMCHGTCIEDPVLTEEEQLLIMKEPIKRKRQSKPIINSKKKTTSLLNSSHFGLQYQSVPTSSINCTKTQSLLSNLNSHYSFNHSGLQATQSGDNRHISSLTLQSRLLASDIATDRLNKSIVKSAACETINSDVLVGITSPAVEHETTVSSTSTVLSSILTAPLMVNVPRYRSNPTKVFLQPSEVLGQKSQSTLSALELTSISKVNTSSSGRECLVQPKVTCKETQQTLPPSSITFSSPPSYKIIYVRPDQVLVCPNKTTTSLNVVPLSKQPQSSAHQVSVLKLPQTSVQNKILSPDSKQRANLSNVTTQFVPQICLGSSSNMKSSPISPKTLNDLRQVLKNAEKVDISNPGKVLIKLKPSTIKHIPQQGGVQTSQVITIGPATSASKNTVYTSLLKDFKSPQNQTTETKTLVNSSHVSSMTPHSGIMTTTVSSAVSKPSNLEVTQALMCLIKSHFQEQTSAGNENILMNLIKGSMQTSDSNNISRGKMPPLYDSQQNIKVADMDIANKLHQTTTHKHLENKQTFQSLVKNITGKDEIYLKTDIVSRPSLPQEGLPSSYVEDWVNQTQTYVSKHLNETNYLPESHVLNPSLSSGTAVNNLTAFKSSLDETLQEHDHLKSHMLADMKSSTLEVVNQRETCVLPKLESQSQHLSNKPNIAHIQKLQVVPNSSNSFTVLNSSLCQNRIQRQADQQPLTQKSARQNGQSISVCIKSQVVTTDSDKSSHLKLLPQNSIIQSALCSNFSQNVSSHAPKPSSLIVNSSEGIKLKINLTELRNENANVTGNQSKNEFSVQKKGSINQEVVIDETEKVDSECAEGDKTETAEEMFQRFQKQAEQEVLKAQMGMGYLSRSLRPTRTNVALIEKYPFEFGTGQSKKKSTSEEKYAHEGSKHAGDNSSWSLSEIDQHANKYMQNKKSNMRNKRQADEVNSKNIKMKQPKLSIKDYPRLKQDGSITNRKRLFCSNILAGHKVYVKFNTYENMVSGRTFLVPFFNIGGTRTQFDVEDMEYINKAVLEFERDERSCARHLLFYAREGQKASFLRKETQLQTSHIEEKNYRKSCFILEGFRRDSRKQTDSSPEQWKVDSTVDIEIDRAEIDNDAEMEFDATMNYDSVIHGQETHNETVTEKRINHSEDERIKSKCFQNACADELSSSVRNGFHSGHMFLNETENHEIIDHTQLSKLKKSAWPRKINVEDQKINKLQQVICKLDSYTNMNRSSSLAPAISDSVPLSSEILVDSEKLRKIEELPFRYSNEVKVAQGQFEEAINSTALKRNTEAINCSFEAAAAEVKLEKPDVGYEKNSQYFGSTHAAQNICSTYFSPNTTTNHRDRHYGKCDIAVKSEPVDECFDLPVESCQIEHSELNIPAVICRDTSALSCNIMSSISGTALPDQQSEHSSPNQPSTPAVLTGHIDEPCTLADSSLISKLHVTDNTILAKTEIRDSKTSFLELSQKSINTGLTSDDICDSVSPSTTSITEPSLPESPLPSSSLSVSSEISVSSDIDGRPLATDAGCLTAIHTELPVPEWTTEDGNKQNKITSLVESLRQRLTEDTSNFPPWLVSTNTEIKKKKKIKIHVKSPAAKLPSTCHAIPSQTLCSSSLTSCTIASNLDQIQSLPCTPPVLRTSLLSSSSTDSVSLVTMGPPALPQDILKPVFATCNLQSPNSIYNKNPMLLPVKQPTELHKPFMKPTSATSHFFHTVNDRSSVELTSHKLVDKLDVTEMEALSVSHIAFDKDQTANCETTLDKADSCVFNSTCESKPVNKCYNSSDFCESTLSNNEHLETVDSYIQSPIDFEIEVGEEDLPETALSLQPVLLSNFATPEQNIVVSHQPLNQGSTRKANSKVCKQKADRPMQTNQEKHLKGNHAESSRNEKGSVTNYLCQKFSFSGAGHKIKGPRFLHMPANNKSGIREQKTPKQNACKVNTYLEPIIVAELSKSPSVVEIFGASVKNEITVNPVTKMDSSEICISQSSLEGNDTKQNFIHLENRKATKRTGKKKRNCMSNSSDLKTSSVKQSIAAMRTKKPASTKPLSSHEVTKSGLPKELAASMPLCKVVLTKLEMLDMGSIDQVSQNVFIIKDHPLEMSETTKMEEHSEGSLATSKLSFRKVIKKKRKKPVKVTKRSIMRPKRDIVDYYAFMLENLQKKARLLEEESKRIAEENARKILTAGIENPEVIEKEKSTNGKIDNAERENNTEEIKTKGINNELDERNKANVEELNNMQVVADLSLQDTSDNDVKDTEAITIDSIADKDCSKLHECEKLDEYDMTDSVGHTDHNQSVKEKCDFGLQTEINDATDSNWAFLQKFCDETIFNQGSNDYLQKIPEEVCFSKITAAELKFEKKDILLGGGVDKETSHTETLNISDTHHEAVAAEDCDEQERDNLHEEELLLGLDIPKSASFVQDGQETVNNPFSLGLYSGIKNKHYSIDNHSIVDDKTESVNIFSGQVTRVPTAAEKDTFSSSTLKLAAAHSEPNNSIINRGLYSDESLQSCATTTQHLKQRNVEVSPSWERLLGHSSLHVIQQSVQENLSSHPGEPAIQSVSLVASSNFKYKFKLPRGILSKAINMSRNMKNIIEEPSKDDSLLSNLEVKEEALNTSYNQVIENSADSKNDQSESSRKEDVALDYVAQTCNNQKYTPSSQMSAIEFKFSPVALTAIQKAKAQFLHKKKRGRKPKHEITVDSQPQTLPAISNDHDVQECDKGQSSWLNEKCSHDSSQIMQPGGVRSGLELLDLFPGRGGCDLNIKLDSTSPCSKQGSSGSTALQEISEDSVMQSGDNGFPESVFHASQTATGNGLDSDCLKQTRKDGIFSNIDFLHDFADEHLAAKVVSDLPSNKEIGVDKILKNSVIDISKLKLKLNPLIASRLKEKINHSDVDVVPSQDDSSRVLNKETLPLSSHKIVLHDCLSQDFELKAWGTKCDLPVSVNVRQSQDKLETNNSKSHSFSSPTDNPNHSSVSTYKQIPHVNATKLCNFLKNFHKNTTFSNVSTNPESLLPDISDSNRAATVTNSSSWQHHTQKSNMLSTLATKIVSNIKNRKRKRKSKVVNIASINEIKTVKEIRKAKEKANQKILTAGSTKLLLPGKLDVEHRDSACDGDIMKYEDKGERSFFDCLSTVPLDVWDDKQEEEL